jgi:hypothetical protein
LRLRTDIALRITLALVLAATVFVPVAANASTCAMPACGSGCCEMHQGAAPATAMSMGSCCAQPGATMSESSCPGNNERPDFKAVSAVPDVVSPAVPLGIASAFGSDPGKGGAAGCVVANARGPGDLLAGTRLRV